MLLRQINQLIVLYGSGAHYNHVLAEVHPLMVLYNHLPCYLVWLYSQKYHLSYRYAVQLCISQSNIRTIGATTR